MTNRGQFLTRKQVAKMINEVDANDDGEIDYSEFLVRTIIYSTALSYKCDKLASSLRLLTLFALIVMGDGS